MVFVQTVIALLFASLGLMNHSNAFNMAEWAHQGSGMPDIGPPSYSHDDTIHPLEEVNPHVYATGKGDNMDDKTLHEYPGNPDHLNRPFENNIYARNYGDDKAERDDAPDVATELKNMGTGSGYMDLLKESSPTNSMLTQDHSSHDHSGEKDGYPGKTEQPKIEMPSEGNEHAKIVFSKDNEMSEHNKANNQTNSTFDVETGERMHSDEIEEASKNDLTLLIPRNQGAEHSVTSGNEDIIIDDSAPITQNMRMDTIGKIDETINKLDHRLQKFLSAVSISAHDLRYYENLLDTAYSTFCKEINGDLGRADTSIETVEPSTNVTISAEMSSAIRRSFDTKIEVLELAASEVAAQKSKETGARTIHDALASGLLHVRSTIAAPGLTIRRTNTEMKTMTSIVEDMRKTLEEDVLSATLMHNMSKKNLFDKILERDEYMKAFGTDKGRIERFTHEIHTFASKFHMLQNIKANATQKQNGFKEYMDHMQEDINTIQRLIDTYFATVHNGHAKAILHEAKVEVNKDDRFETQLRLHKAEDKVRIDALREAKGVEDRLACPANYRPLHPEKSIGNFNPCVRIDKWV